MPILIPVLVLFLAGFLSVQAAEPSLNPPGQRTLTKNIGVEEFEKLRAKKTNVVLDVRTRREFAAGHIPGAIHIDIKDRNFEQKVAALGTNKTYLVYCAVGGRSAQACDRLSRLRFGELYNLDGGIKDWTKAGNNAAR